MIKRVKLENFACHEKTELELPEGLIIFLGRNGAGKSSVIDAITYALYGEHSRGSNTNIVRDGANGGQVELEFSLGGIEYKVLRRFNSKGALEHSYLKGNGKTLATGERKREGDDVAQQIRKLLGVNYNQMLSAVVIQQGELDRILSEEPKDVKNLFDEIMGLTKMEEAYKNMPDLLEAFRNKVRERTGWDLNDLQKVEEEIEKKRNEYNVNLQEYERLKINVNELENKWKEQKEKYSKLEDVKKAWDMLEILKSKLELICKNIIDSLNTVEEKLPLLNYRDIVNSRLKEIEVLEEEREKKESELDKKEGELNGIKNSLRRLTVPKTKLKRAKPLETIKAEALEKAEKLKNDSIELGKHIALKTSLLKILKNRVKRDVKDVVAIVLASYYAGSTREVVEIIKRGKRLSIKQEEIKKQIKRLDEELKKLDEKIANLSYIDKKPVVELNDEIKELEKAIKRLGGVEKIHKHRQDLVISQNVLKILDEAEKKKILPKIKDLSALESILGEDKNLSQLIERLKKTVAIPYDIDELERFGRALDELNRQLGEKQAQLRITAEKIKELDEEIKELEEARRELIKASEFYELLTKIRNEIYHRDGPVIKSVRTWALSNVSDRAANYLNLFDVRISDIRLEEKGRGISFECSYGGRKVDSKRLSGGEKVALALAIRLAVSDVLGADRFGFFILDEPTVHLDSENKKKLQEVFANLGKAVRQTIIITHDEEVFEDADAMILKFDRGPAPNAPTEVRVYNVFS